VAPSFGDGFIGNLMTLTDSIHPGCHQIMNSTSRSVLLPCQDSHHELGDVFCYNVITQLSGVRLFSKSSAFREIIETRRRPASHRESCGDQATVPAGAKKSSEIPQCSAAAKTSFETNKCPAFHSFSNAPSADRDD
jgi:hypothetical protein